MINDVEHVVELLAPGFLQVISRFFLGSLQVVFLLKFKEALLGQIILRLNYVSLRTHQTFFQ